MLKMMKKNTEGFASITEVIVTSVIFLIAVAGVLTAVTMIRPQSVQSFKRLEGTYAGRTVIDDLYTGISASTWMNSSSPYAVNTVHSITMNGILINYVLQDMSGFPADSLPPRRLTMNITIPDM